MTNLLGVIILNKSKEKTTDLRTQMLRLQKHYNDYGRIKILGVYNDFRQIPRFKRNTIQITVYKKVTVSNLWTVLTVLSLFAIPSYSKNYYFLQTSYFDQWGREHKIPYYASSTPHEVIWAGWIFLPFFWLSDFNTHFLERIHYEIQKIINNRNLMQRSDGGRKIPVI
ncbi:MAG: hypothetical protein AAF518_06450 [Spirochaetota bacterium]